MRPTRGDTAAEEEATVRRCGAIGGATLVAGLAIATTGAGSSTNRVHVEPGRRAETTRRGHAAAIGIIAAATSRGPTA
jgi:hypothetical protein